jgi:hypothetical protein
MTGFFREEAPFAKNREVATLLSREQPRLPSWRGRKAEGGSDSYRLPARHAGQMHLSAESSTAPTATRLHTSAQGLVVSAT